MAENKGRVIWRKILNFAPIRWLLNIPVCKKIGNSGIGQKLFCYETVSYLFFGVLTTVVSIATYWVSAELIGDGVSIYFFGEMQSLGYIVANTISWVCAVLFAYVTNKIFVFESKTNGASQIAKEILLFAGARLFTFFVEIAFMVVTISVMGMNDKLSKILAQIIVLIANYILSKILVFRKPKDKES